LLKTEVIVLHRGEKGQALIIAMILMLLGSLIIVPMLAYMGAGLKAGTIQEERTGELYAADAGVEDALWHIHDVNRLKQLIQEITGETLPDDWTPEDYTGWPIVYEPINDMNGECVEVEIYLDSDDDEIYFNINSVGKEDTADSKYTTIDAHVSGLKFNLLDNAITSKGTVDLKSTVYGGDVIWCTGEEPPQDQVIGGDVVQNCDVDWPEAALFSRIYLDQVLDDPSHEEVSGNETITLNNDQNIGPLYVDGDLTIQSAKKDVTLTLQGTVYVTGKLKLGKTSQDFSLNLNSQTIFVQDPTILSGSATKYSPGTYAAEIGGRTSIIGSGCLIAVGDINFQPNMQQGSTDDFMFIFSIEGTTYAHPSGEFNGSFAGNLEVQLFPGDPTSTNLYWNDPYDNNLNFPQGGYLFDKFYAQIDAWEIALD
jgi:hypothetical protein